LEQALAPPAVELHNISKAFGSNRALDGVDLRIGSGEVVGLLGQNGSGKSTLVKIMSGVYDPEPGGRMLVGGAEVPLPLPPGQASEIGLSFVYQNLALAPGLTVLENLTLGQRITAHGWRPINWPAFAAVFLGVTAIKPGRINPLGAFIAVYFLATGTAGFQLLGTQSYIQQIFYGAALVAAITIPKANRERFFKKRRTAEAR